MKNNIIKIEPITPVFSITWNLGLRCNFDCMYCPEYYHNLSDADKPLAELKQIWRDIVDKTQHKKLKYKIAFTGGEVTINKDFLPFVQWLDDRYRNEIAEVGITTNGSASAVYYTELITLDVVKYISFSVHSEFFNESKFFENVLIIDNMAKHLGKMIHVNIMDEYWNKENIKTYCDFLAGKNINYTVNEIDYSDKIRDDFRQNNSSQRYNFHAK